MKFLITLATSLLVGLALAASDFAPLNEMGRILKNRRKIFWSLALAAMGFVFAMSAFLVALIEGALQYDAQGFVMWSAMFSVAVLLLAMGVLALATARYVNPLTTAASEPDFRQTFISALESQLTSKGLRDWLERMSASASPQEPKTQEREFTAPADNRFHEFEQGHFTH